MNAFATIVTHYDDEYVLSALVLGLSIKETNPSVDMVALVLKEVVLLSSNHSIHRPNSQSRFNQSKEKC